MKKVISLILIAVMLLGALPVLASAETEATAKFTGYTVSLGESIAVEFYTDAANVADFAKVVFYKNDTLMEDATITSCPAAEANGRVYFKFSQLGPHEMDATIKAELYLTTSDAAVNTASVSVLDYCTAVYAQGNEKLDTLIVNMLNYGAAAETYMNDGTAISEHAVTLGIDLSAIGDATVNELTSTVYQEVEGATVEITKAALVLNSGIVPSFTFTTEEDVSGLTAMVSCAGKTWEISSFEETETANTYTFDFNGMNPSRVRSGILVAFKNANGDLVSNIRVFTAEHYAASAEDEAVKALTGAMLHYGDAAKAYVTRNISSGALTEEEKTVLSALTVEPYAATKKTNQNVVIWAYKEAGIDVSANFDKTVFTLMKMVFSESGGVRSLVQPSSSTYDATYSGMLVDGYYGGAAVTEIESKTFSEADLQVGDVFFAVFYEPDTENPNTLVKRYCAGVYLGSGKFLMSKNPGNSWTTAIETNTVIGADLAEEYDIYFILRPEQVAPRDFTSGVMTNMEKAVISALTVEQYKAAIAADATVKDSGIAKWAYAQAGIDVSANFDKSVWNLMYAIFGGDTSGRYPHLPNSTSYKAQYSRMLVDGYYAGEHVTWDKGFENADFQVGDVFLAVYYPDLTVTGTRKYYAGICLGGDNFLISNNAEGTYSATTAIKTFDEIVNANMGIYFVLRPEQLAQEAPKGLIAETRAKLAALTADNSELAKKTNSTGVLNWICTQYGMDTQQKSVASIGDQLFHKPTDEYWTPIEYVEGNIYQKVLVEGYYGGVKFETDKTFTIADFEIGDIFCARDINNKDYVGLYVGDGAFLMYNGATGEKTRDTVTVFADSIATDFNQYYILRPAQYFNTPASN